VQPWTDALQRVSGAEPIVVGPGVRTGVPVRTDNPHEVGPDRVVNAVAAHAAYGGPCIVVDFGTSTNFDVVSAAGEFVGGAIAPGVEVSMDALQARAARLGKIELATPPAAIGKSSVASMQSGAVYGFAGQVDGIVRRIQAELGGPCPVVATGGLAPLIAPHTESVTVSDPALTLTGLRLVWERNGADPQ
jgi:type III pantothenate kinase